MKIKKVEIVGFKSFVEKVSLDFQDGVTAILGPNGCGKSNIVDALRWAMGEQNAKNLRGRSMEDVIFGGSESRKPLGMAEVSMVFSNEDGLAPPAFRDYSEIMVTRRLHRNGESEYLLNKTPCRLLDISELFMDTGVGARAYSIIEQGKIGMILNAKPEERRFLIEEAAGVTKFKSRKKSALRKIEATRQNLLRLGDIIAEVRRQLASLKRQAQKAERFRELRQELRQIEVRFARERFEALAAETAEVSRRMEEHRHKLTSLSAQHSGQTLRAEELRLEQSILEKEASSEQERVFHLTTEIQKVEGKLEMGAREEASLELQRERLMAESQEGSRRFSELELEEKELQNQQDSLGSGLESERRRLAEGETFLEEISLREGELSQQLDEGRTSLFALLTDLSRLSSRCEEGERRLQALAERRGRNRGEAVRVREQRSELEAALRALKDDLKRLIEDRLRLQGEREQGVERNLLLRRRMEENESELLVHQDSLNRTRSRLESLQELEKSLEGYGSGVRTLLGKGDFRERFTQMAADVLDVPPHLETAVEAVLGDRLQALLAPAVDDVLVALEGLRGQEGRCAFLFSKIASPPQDSVRISDGISLSELVQSAPGHEGALSLLSGVFLVPSLAPFLTKDPLPAGAILVTEEGETLTHRGEISGGGAGGSDTGLLQRKRQMKELAARAEEVAGVVEKLQHQRMHLREEVATLEGEIRDLEGALHRTELKVMESEKDIERQSREVQRLEDHLEVLSLEEDQLHAEEEELQTRLAESRVERREGEARKEGLEEMVAGLQEQMQVLKREADVLRERVTALKVTVASIQEREEGGRRSLERLSRLRSELQSRRALLEKQIKGGEQERLRLTEEASRHRTELEILLRRREEQKSRFETLRARMEDSAQRIAEEEGALKRMLEQLGREKDEVAALQLRMQELVLESDHLRDTFQERYQIDLVEVAPPGDAFDPAAAESRLGQLRRLINEIGEVNLTAIEECREMEERFAFLTGQQEDLRQSLEGLQAAIAKINRTTRKRFRETFDLVNGKFQEIFPRLFRGGRAELHLTDEEDLLETGVEIIVQPPGKKLQGVNLLSGGEKALTAVALIFSIFLIKPSPFCMLDEVDAPLDDANIGRFNEMIREMSAISQFIIITHSKRTMEVADTLYGVTMEEPGISKLVSVRMHDFQV
jgi:chromosome segregation protein